MSTTPLQQKVPFTHEVSFLKKFLIYNCRVEHYGGSYSVDGRIDQKILKGKAKGIMNARLQRRFLSRNNSMQFLSGSELHQLFQTCSKLRRYRGDTRAILHLQLGARQNFESSCATKIASVNGPLDNKNSHMVREYAGIEKAMAQNSANNDYYEIVSIY